MSTGGGGGGGYTPTQEERALSAEQTLLLRQQRELLDRQLREQDLLQPILLGQLGLTPTYSEGVNPARTALEQQIAAINSQIAATPQTAPGAPRTTGLDPRQPAYFSATQANPAYQQLIQQRDALTAQLNGLPNTTRTLTGYEDTDTPEELAQKRLSELSLAEAEAQAASLPQRQEIESLTRERTLAALKGELPIDPTLTRELETQEANLRAQLRSQLGPGFETSTPGIEALADFQRRKAELIYGAQRDQITLGEQLSGAREAASRESAFTAAGLGSQLQSSQLGQIFNYGVPGRGIDFSQVAGGFNGPLSLMAQNRQAGANAAAQRQAGQYSLFGSLLGAGAYVAGAAIGSDRRIKTDIKKVGKTEGGLPIYKFRYKGDTKMQMGVMAQDVEKKSPELVHEIFGVKHVDYRGVK